METGLEGKPWYVAGGIGLLIAVVLVVAAYMTIFTGIEKEIVKKDRALAGLEEQIREGQAAQQTLPQFREQVRGLELELEKLLKILPSRRKTDDLLRRIRALTEQGDFNLLTFRPRSPQPLDDFYSEWPIEIQLDGTHHNLALFFDRISRFRRIINIENLRVTPKTAVGSPHTISANFIAKTFLYNEPEAEADP